MQKVVVSLSKTFALWIFFMIYPGVGHEDFNVVKMLAMFILAFGICYYIYLDME